MSESRPALSASHLSRTFASRAGVVVEAVRDASLELLAGEVVLIMGPSGSGKTTLLSMLGCLIEPSGGNLEVAGRDVSSLDQRQLTSVRQRHFGFVFQNHHLFDELTVVDNVELALNLTGVRRPDSRRRAQALLAELELDHRARFRPQILSGGEKQRVSIARALITDPPILLADEPTGSLDSVSGDTVIDMLRDAARSRNKAVLIVSHDARIQRHAQRTLHMEDGRLG